MQIKGTINKIKDTEVIKDSFKKREFWLTIEDDPKYPQTIALEFIQDKVSEIDRYNEGDKVDVEFNLRGREYNGRVYVNLQAWKIKMQDGYSAQPQSAVDSSKPKSLVTDLDSLPF